MTQPMSAPFWKTKTLAEMSPEEWESLCDGCGRCCLVKLEDEDTGKIHFTNLACKLLDRQTCRCSDYANRSARVPDCVRLTPENVSELNWLPDSCAYRRLARGQTLAWWHPLVSGRKASVAEAGISVRGQVRSEEGVGESEYEDHLWKLPRARKPVSS
ncbi:YcgN family cysteine cluster protein [Taklimakanibacter lacteus]|uniref:YcgN family cysteine cluster protein n=1 Tax=Taklimakanibacter lacteus TaxID=2268456 RepID=UPI0034D7A9B4